MARLTYFDGIEHIAALLKHFHERNLNFVGDSTQPSGFVLGDGSGITLTAVGTGLVYNGDGFAVGGFDAGKITKFEIRDAGGNLLYSVGGLSLMAVDFGPSTFKVSIDSGHSLFAGDDVVIGTAMSDALASGRGDDVLRGGNSKDLLFSGSGNDTMYGGGGPDQFFFQPKNKGHDHIMDFTDNGTGQDDVLVMTTAMHNVMVVSAVGQGVELTFGAEHVIVHGWTVGQVGNDDFILNG